MKNGFSGSLLTATRPLWVIRAAKHPDAHSLFTKQNVVALEDQGLGDLKKLKKDREAFYSAYRTLQPNDSQVSIAGIAGKFFRFAHETTEGDFVLYPATKEKRIYVATVVSSYRYDASLSAAYPHQRQVKWLGSFANSALSQTARQELGAARMLFQLKRHDKEVRRLVASLMASQGSKSQFVK
jgi:predicted Mrr-cat superfamily restriction endonuclease